MKWTFIPKGVCSRGIEIEVEDGVIRSVKFDGGCNGNGQAIGALAEGMRAEDYIARCKSIICGSKTTSCPAQLALALEEALAKAQ